MNREGLNRHLLIGLEGQKLNAWEISMLRESPPLGVILFARNIESPQQVKALLDSVRQCTGEASWAAIDEEGGRVHRMPWAPFHPRRPATEYGRMMQDDRDGAIQAVYDDNLHAGKALKELGFTHNCAPVLDLFHPDGHGIIGERAYGSDVETVASLAGACLRGLYDAGIEGVGKHFPGHGRANADSHVAVPQVDAPLETLLAEAQSFARLIETGLRHVMTAHVIYAGADERIATLSPFWLGEVLRGRFAFPGHIWSDDLSMKGAGDDVPAAARAAIAAGCDVLPVCQPEGVRAVYQDLSKGVIGSVA